VGVGEHFGGIATPAVAARPVTWKKTEKRGSVAEWAAGAENMAAAGGGVEGINRSDGEGGEGGGIHGADEATGNIVNGAIGPRASLLPGAGADAGRVVDAVSRNYDVWSRGVGRREREGGHR
jgi:hypothetical protein